jgi:hypothetical protein
MTKRQHDANVLDDFSLIQALFKMSAKFCDNLWEVKVVDKFETVVNMPLQFFIHALEYAVVKKSSSHRALSQDPVATYKETWSNTTFSHLYTEMPAAYKLSKSFRQSTNVRTWKRLVHRQFYNKVL